jgi:hypothetical protein
MTQPEIPVVPPVAAPVDAATLLDEPAAKPWYRRPLIWGLVLGALLLVAGLAWWWFNRAANAAPSYTTQAVAPWRPHAHRHRQRHLAAHALHQHRQRVVGHGAQGQRRRQRHSFKKGQVLVELGHAPSCNGQILRAPRGLAQPRTPRSAQVQATVKEVSSILATATRRSSGPLGRHRCLPRPSWTPPAPRWRAPRPTRPVHTPACSDARAPHLDRRRSTSPRPPSRAPCRRRGAHAHGRPRQRRGSGLVASGHAVHRCRTT